MIGTKNALKEAAAIKEHMIRLLLEIRCMHMASEIDAGKYQMLRELMEDLSNHEAAITIILEQIKHEQQKK